MSPTHYPPAKAVYSTKDAWEYVNGRPFFGELLRAYPEILKPVRRCRTPGGATTKTQYLKASIDCALKAALLSQQFVAK